MKHLLTFVFFILLFANANAQVKIGGIPAVPDASAVLELDGGNTRGLLLPRMHKMDMLAITNPAEGLTLYVTDEQATYLRRSGNWVKLSGSGDPFTLPYTGIFTQGTAPVLSLSNGSIAGTGIYGAGTLGAGTGVHGDAGGFNSTGIKGTSVFGRGGYFNSRSNFALITDSGSVGFGTLSPTAFVEIDASRNSAGNTMIINDDDDPQIQFRKAGINKSYIKQQGNDLILRPNDQNFAGKVILQGYNQGGWMFVDADGNSSFGQDPATFNGTPNNARVHIKSTNGYPLTLDAPVGSGGPALRFIDKTGNSINSLARINASASSLYTSHQTGKYEWAGNHTSRAMVLQEAGDDVIHFDNLGVTGFIGAGILSPEYPLHITSPFDITPTVMIQSYSPTIHFDASYGSQGFISQVVNDLKIGTLAANDKGRFIIRTNGADRLWVDSVGYVTIGDKIGPTINGPYKLAVKGKVAATDFNVVASGSWPDYVFAPSYHLRSLEETEAYIKEHKHLPNIPAASIVEKEGFALGDMQKRMMEKIEELTLYLIDAKKEINTLKQQVQVLQTKK